MKKTILQLFEDEQLIKKVKEKLPHLFQLAEIDNSRGGKLGMEIGSARERILVALLIYKFGEKNIKTNVGVTETETDVVVFNEPISIKTVTGKKISGIKLIWTVDPQKALDFSHRYTPRCGIILVQINWNGKGYFYLFPKNSQEDVLRNIGRNQYIKLPKLGTNPRGVEMSGKAIEELSKHKDTKIIEIDWKRETINYNPYDRWVDHWIEE